MSGSRLVALALLLASCRHSDGLTETETGLSPAAPGTPTARFPAGAAPAPAAPLPPPLVDDTFDDLYPLLLHRTPAPQKAETWRRVQHRYVRWTGRFVALTQKGATFKQLPHTVTFDVSLTVEPGAWPGLRRLRHGDTVTYTGQLASYDDVFRTLYLAHGDVAPPPPPVDGGLLAPAASHRLDSPRRTP